VRRAANGFLRILALTVGVCSGQVPPAHYIEIDLPPGVASEAVFIRYVLAGEKFGGWIQPRSGVSSYVIGTSVGVLPATGIKAIVYAPGCAIQTLGMRLSSSRNEQYPFLCRPLGNVWIEGRLTDPTPFVKHGARLQARYIARWAHGFLGLADDSVLVIPVGDSAGISADGRFRLSVPDLARDPLAGAPGAAGEIQIWAEDKTTNDLLAQLIPTDRRMAMTRMGGLKVQSEYPETPFTPCAINRALLHDATGFAQRSDIDGCDR
jgi:hypothetical protein